MMFKMLDDCRKIKRAACILCSELITEIFSHPDVCKDFFHYKCLRTYVDEKLNKKEPVTCPICTKLFGKIANKSKCSKDVIYQNVILSNEESICGICFSKYRHPVAYSDSCNHVYCYECLKKWCTFKHECPMDRMPVKMLILSDFPGGHVLKKVEPPAIEQDLNGDGDNDEINNTICEICNLGNNDELLLLCDNCNKGYHIYCLRTPLNEIPEGDWFCDNCAQSSDGDLNVFSVRLQRGLRGAISNIENRLRTTRPQSTNRQIRNRNSRRNLRSSRTEELSDETDEDLSLNNVFSRRLRPRPRTNPLVESESEEMIPNENTMPLDNDVAEPVQPISSNRRVLIAESDLSDDPNSNNGNQVQTSSAPVASTSNSDVNLASPQRIQQRASRRVRSTRRSTLDKHRQESQSSEPESEEEIDSQLNRCLRQKPVKQKTDDDEDEESDQSYTPGQELSLPKTWGYRGKRKKKKREKSGSIIRKRRKVLDDSEDDDRVETGGERNNNCVENLPSTSNAGNELSEICSSSSIRKCSNSTQINSTDNSSNIPTDESRSRHSSGSSGTLSTIPCTVSSKYIENEDYMQQLCKEKVESDERDESDIYTDNYSSGGDYSVTSSESSEDEYIPSNYTKKTGKSKRNVDNFHDMDDNEDWRPSTTVCRTVRATTSKLKVPCRRKVTHQTRKRKCKKRRKLNKSPVKRRSQPQSRFLSDKLDINGRRSLYVNNDSETSFERPTSKQSVVNRNTNNIIDNINESQNRLFNMTLSNIKRSEDGTITINTNFINSPSKLKPVSVSVSSSTNVNNKCSPTSSVHCKSPHRTPNGILFNNNINSSTNLSPSRVKKPTPSKSTYPSTSASSHTSHVSSFESTISNNKSYFKPISKSNLDDTIAQDRVAQYLSCNSIGNPCVSTSEISNHNVPTSSTKVGKHNNGTNNSNNKKIEDDNYGNSAVSYSTSIAASSNSSDKSKSEKTNIKEAKKLICKCYEENVIQNSEYNDLSKKEKDGIKERITNKVLKKVSMKTVLTTKRVRSFIIEYIKFYRERLRKRN